MCVRLLVDCRLYRASRLYALRALVDCRCSVSYILAHSSGMVTENYWNSCPATDDQKNWHTQKQIQKRNSLNHWGQI